MACTHTFTLKQCFLKVWYTSSNRVRCHPSATRHPRQQKCHPSCTELGWARTPAPAAAGTTAHTSELKVHKPQTQLSLAGWQYSDVDSDVSSTNSVLFRVKKTESSGSTGAPNSNRQKCKGFLVLRLLASGDNLFRDLGWWVSHFISLKKKKILKY